MLYFAYGSNLPFPRIHSRLSSAQLYATARLPGYELCFHKPGRDGSAKCDIRPSNEPTVCVHGAVYRIDPAERAALDRFEGRGYRVVDIEVESEQGPLGVFAYRATDIDPKLKAYAWYREHVVRGVIEHGFPETYLKHIRAVEVIDDPDTRRHQREMAIYDDRD